MCGVCVCVGVCARALRSRTTFNSRLCCDFDMCKLLLFEKKRINICAFCRAVGFVRLMRFCWQDTVNICLYQSPSLHFRTHARAITTALELDRLAGKQRLNTQRFRFREGGKNHTLE